MTFSLKVAARANRDVRIRSLKIYIQAMCIENTTLITVLDPAGVPVTARPPTHKSRHQLKLECKRTLQQEFPVL